jgi:flagellar hook-length control protein FliK
MTTASALTTAVTATTPAGGPAANTATANGAAQEGEVLSVVELLRLLEQGESFTQAMAGAAAPPTSDPAQPGAAPPTGAAPPAVGARRAARADAHTDGDLPCDIVTLIRLLEQQGQSATPAAMAAGLAAADALARVAAPPPAPVAIAGGDGVTAVPVRPATTGAAAPPATGGAPSEANSLHAAADEAQELLATALAATTAKAPQAAASGQEAATTPTAAPVTPLADPAQVTLNLAQSFRTEMPSSPPLERVVHVPVRDPAWPQAVAAEIQFLADQKVEAATLRLSPEHLGPLEVRIDVRDGSISVNFGVTHGDTQAALEQALPRLREMFAAAGLQLGQTSVQQETRRGSHNGGAAPAGAGATADNGNGAATAPVRGLGLVDEYV